MSDRNGESSLDHPCRRDLRRRRPPCCRNLGSSCSVPPPVNDRQALLTGDASDEESYHGSRHRRARSTSPLRRQSRTDRGDGHESNQLALVEPTSGVLLFEMSSNNNCPCGDIKIISNSCQPIAFKVKCTTPDMFFVHPHRGIINPYCRSDISVKMINGDEKLLSCVRFSVTMVRLDEVDFEQLNKRNFWLSSTRAHNSKFLERKLVCRLRSLNTGDDVTSVGHSGLRHRPALSRSEMSSSLSLRHDVRTAASSPAVAAAAWQHSFGPKSTVGNRCQQYPFQPIESSRANMAAEFVGEDSDTTLRKVRQPPLRIQPERLMPSRADGATVNMELPAVSVATCSGNNPTDGELHKVIAKARQLLSRTSRVQMFIWIALAGLLIAAAVTSYRWITS